LGIGRLDDNRFSDGNLDYCCSAANRNSKKFARHNERDPISEAGKSQKSTSR